MRTEEYVARFLLNPSRVLVVEDSMEVRNLLKMMLALLGIQVMEAVNGEEAITAIQDGGFDLIFLDLRLPIIDGFEVLEAAKTMGNKTPIIVMSAFLDERIVNKVTEIGVSSFLRKPEDMTKERIKNCCETYKLKVIEKT